MSKTTPGNNDMRGPSNDSGRRVSAWALNMLLCVTCYLAVVSTAQAATYYWQDTIGTSVAGFTTDSTGCGSQENNIFLTTLMSAGGFNCADFRHEGQADND